MDNTPKASDSLNNLIPQFGEKTTNISPADKRQNFNTYLAGTLALMLWGTLIGVIFWHAFAINYISKSLWGTSSSIEEVQKKSETSSALINDTAKTLYSLIGPLATAVTGFYYNSVALSKSNSREEDND
ncbi:MAG: hypothetical protein HWQ35_00790 [Nostoc sp. NMS1]|uniref:hypothetical protein n=1 Tax=unclassified Nostoc TaxID=2593658 RepID=UPI0025DE9D7B|nr:MULTISPECIES: hypothetical protein [unclassified Nostoc]MBN3905161.1 hypothetical protein [Nostoc sp. NMS1]MBN3989640.1 hypothetical protein [Nostoc sp. NMS2]